jgi:hypothetical protein
VEGPVADDGASAFPAILLWLAGGVLWEVAVAGQSAAGAGPGRGRVARHGGPAPAMAPFPVPGCRERDDVVYWYLIQ